MSIWNYLSQNGDPKRTLGSLPQKSVNWNYTAPSDNTKTPSANTTGVYYPNMKNDNFTKAISYGLLGPAFYRLLQLRDGDAQRIN